MAHPIFRNFTRGALAVAMALALSMTTAVVTVHGEDAGLNDAQIAHVAVTASIIDIAYAHLALAISEDPSIRQFAETMISDHSAVNAKAGALAKKLSLTPENNDVSKKLLADAKRIKDDLSQKRGCDFNTAYARNELAYHQAVNGALETLLIPGAQNAELRQLLESALPIFKEHEGHAEKLNSQLGE